MGKDDRTYIGIDLGGTNIQAGVLDGRNRLLGRSKAKTLSDEGADKVVKRVARVAIEAAEEARVPMTRVAGVCVAPSCVEGTEPSCPRPQCTAAMACSSC
jgi:glucokinase